MIIFLSLHYSQLDTRERGEGRLVSDLTPLALTNTHTYTISYDKILLVSFNVLDILFNRTVKIVYDNGLVLLAFSSCCMWLN